MTTASMLVGIAGPSGSGKTTLATGLKQRLESSGGTSVVLLSEDAYYRDQAHLPLPERAAQNFDDPAALDHELLLSHLHQLQAGQSIRQPVYDYSSHTRSGQWRRVEPARMVLVEGLFILAVEPLRRLLTLSLYVDTSPDLCLLRRLRRDVRERGRSPDSVLDQYLQTVRPGTIRHVAPSRTHAARLLDGNGDTTTLIGQGWQALQEELPQLSSGTGD